jgi:hypothetical protein
VFEVRIHGRGGQGVVTAAELLSVAAFLEDSLVLALGLCAAECPCGAIQMEPERI